VVLQSPALNYNSNCVLVGFTLSCGGYLPSYGATGAWFNRTNPAPTDLGAYVQQMRDYTRVTYEPANAQWFLGTPPAATLLTELQNLTGIAATTWQNNFNLGPGAVQQRLLAGQVLGRYDARVFAPVGSPLASEGDPSSTLIAAQFANAIANHLVSGLQYGNASTYVLLSGAIRSWTFSHDGHPLPDTIPDLATALALNPSLKVLAVNGYHDLATPFHQTERDLARLGANANVTVRSYVGGHMTYLDDASRPLQRADLEAFYRYALAQ
jgi:carboxypeptidase C (cathepsin A)